MSTLPPKNSLVELPPLALTLLCTWLPTRSILDLAEASPKRLAFLRRNGWLWRELLQRDFNGVHLPCDLMVKKTQDENNNDHRAETAAAAAVRKHPEQYRDPTGTGGGGGDDTNDNDDDGKEPPLKINPNHQLLQREAEKEKEKKKKTQADNEDAMRYKRAYEAFRFEYVKWHPRPAWEQTVRSREGHDQCAVLGGSYVFLRHGFVNDPRVHLLPTELTPASSSSSATTGKQQQQSIKVLRPRSGALGMAYGQRLSAVEDDLVIQFGGLTQGGYRGCTNLLALSKIELQSNSVDDRTFRSIPPSILAPRGFHAQCYDAESQMLYIHGGLLEGGVCAAGLYSIDVAALRRQSGVFCPPPASSTTATSKSRANRNDDNHDEDVIPRTAAAAATTNHQETLDWSSIITCHHLHEDDTVVQPRWGHSMVLINGCLYLSGGYDGSGMYALQDGRDFKDIWRCEVKSLWPSENGRGQEEEQEKEEEKRKQEEENTVAGPRWTCCVSSVNIPRCLGRCHSACAYGPLIVYFGGTVALSSRLLVFDTRDGTVWVPSETERINPDFVKYKREEEKKNPIFSRGGVRMYYSPPQIRPTARLSHAATIVGSRIIITGGWTATEDAVMEAWIGELIPASSSLLAHLKQQQKPSSEAVAVAVSDDNDVDDAPKTATATTTKQQQQQQQQQSPPPPSERLLCTTPHVKRGTDPSTLPKIRPETDRDAHERNEFYDEDDDEDVDLSGGTGALSIQSRLFNIFQRVSRTGRGSRGRGRGSTNNNETTTEEEEDDNNDDDDDDLTAPEREQITRLLSQMLRNGRGAAAASESDDDEEEEEEEEEEDISEDDDDELN